MEFFETAKGIWIPKGTALKDHAPKTRNYALLADLDIDGVKTLDALVSLPPFPAALSLSNRVLIVEDAIAESSSDPRNLLNPNDYLVRSALTFEDTVATRAAGIGLSARFVECWDSEHLAQLLHYEGNADISAYTKKHGISSFGLGVQLCSTIVYEDGDVAYSGSLKLLADDFVEITVNDGHSFEGLQNKVPAFRYYFQKEGSKWKKKFERKDNFMTDLDDNVFLELLARPLFAALKFLKKRKDFPEGFELEYVKETQVSPVTLVQYAPIPYLKENFQEAIFTYSNEDPTLYMQILIGSGECYFHPEDIFILKNQTPSAERESVLALRKFNQRKQGGYLLIDTRDNDERQIVQFPYPDIYNAKAFLHPYAHINRLSDHDCNIAREEGILIAAPYRWRVGSSSGFRSIPNFEDSARSQGVSLRVNERTQECFVAYGNVWQ
jgi:hypothetical protein